MQPELKIQNRILEHVKKDDNGCWIWQLHIGKTGYGQMWVTTAYQKGSNYSAHRVSYKAFKGEVADDLQVDHLCKVRACVNPDHLEAVTPKENVNRSDAYYKKLRAQTHCLKGHEFSKDNTRERKNEWGGISRTCITCEYERQWSRYVIKNPNAIKGKSRGSQLAERTHCKHGHDFAVVGFYLYDNARKCKECNRLANARNYKPRSLVYA